MFSIWVQHEGLWMGLGPFAVWQMVDYPNKRTNYLGFPLCAWAPWRAAEGPATRPANSGSAGTEGCTHTSPVSFPGVFIVPPFPFHPIFHCQLLLILLPLGKVSITANRSWRTFVSTQFFFVLGGDYSWPWFEDDLKCRWVYFDWLHLPSGSGAIMKRRPTNGPCSTRIYVGKTTETSLSVWIVLLCSIFRGDTYKANLIYS